VTEITGVEGWEVLDSRGNPTVRVRVEAGGGASDRTGDDGAATGTFTVPAGASTGSHEAVERRDGGDRYGGTGVRSAVDAVNEELADVVAGRDVHDQSGVDDALVAYDGTESLEAVGANAVLGVSGAILRAASDDAGEPLYRYLGSTGAGPGSDDPGRIPLPMVNVLSGGLHAQGGIEIQDFLVVPAGAETYPEAIETVWEVRQAVRERIVDAGHRPLLADEGGFSPPLDAIDDAFDLLAAGVRDAGHVPATDDVAFAVDVAATHFYDAERGVYDLASMGRTLDSSEMVDLVADWTDRYPLVSVEDPLAEDDLDGWARMRETLPAGVQLLGDDLIVTNRDRLARADERDAAEAVLVKPNQAGTVSRTVEVVRAAQDGGFAPVVSARSGETCDATIADLAVALDAGQIKIGSLARSERLAKYNRLFRIDDELDSALASFPR
jgi:enolase